MQGRGKNIIEERNGEDEVTSTKSGSPEVSHVASPDVAEIDPRGTM